MPRAREKTLARLRAKTKAGDTAAAWHATTLRARLKLAAALRDVLAHLGADPATVVRLTDIEANAAGLAIRPDDAAPADAPPAAGQAEVSGQEFWARIAKVGERIKPDIDLAQASLAETLAWCLTHAD